MQTASLAYYALSTLLYRYTREGERESSNRCYARKVVLRPIAIFSRSAAIKHDRRSRTREIGAVCLSSGVRIVRASDCDKQCGFFAEVRVASE